jgi:hypothetical protein
MSLKTKPLTFHSFVCFHTIIYLQPTQVAEVPCSLTPHLQAEVSLLRTLTLHSFGFLPIAKNLEVEEGGAIGEAANGK